MQDSTSEIQSTEVIEEAQPVPEMDAINALLSEEAEPQAEVEETEAVEELLTEDAEPETEEAEPEQEATGIDYEQQIPMANGESVSLSELKDSYQAQTDKLMEVIERENAVKQEFAQMQDLAVAIEALPPEHRDAALQAKAADVKRENLMILETIPEWKDEAKLKQGYTQIMEMAAAYGAADAVKGITDHRLVNILNDYARIRASVKAAKVAPKKKFKPAGKKPTNVKPVKPKGTELDQINELIGG